MSHSAGLIGDRGASTGSGPLVFRHLAWTRTRLFWCNHPADPHSIQLLPEYYPPAINLTTHRQKCYTLLPGKLVANGRPIPGHQQDTASGSCRFCTVSLWIALPCLPCTIWNWNALQKIWLGRFCLFWSADWSRFVVNLRTKNWMLN